METKIKKITDSRIEILFEVSWQEFQAYLDKAYAELGKDLKIPGFRPGKAPKEMLEKYIGEIKALNLAGETIIKQKYTDYVQKNNPGVIGSPAVEILKLAKGNPFSFKVIVDIIPEISLPDYKKILSELKKKKPKPVEEKEIEQALKWLQQSRAKLEELKEPAQKGYFIEIEYNSPEIENNKTFNDAFFLGQGKLVPGFEDNLIGMSAGEEKEFNLTFPKDYNDKKLSGKRVAFKVKLKKVQKSILPELDDEFAKSLGSFKDFKSLKESIKQGIKEEKTIQVEQELRNNILNKIIEQTKIEVPQSLLILEKERLMKELEKETENNLNIKFEEYLKKTNKTRKEIEDSLAESAEKRIKEWLILKEVGKKEKIEVKQEEIDEQISKYPYQEELDLERLRDYYKEVIYNKKVLDKLEKYVSNNSNSN